jgi:hypothetical protein
MRVLRDHDIIPPKKLKILDMFGITGKVAAKGYHVGSRGSVAEGYDDAEPVLDAFGTPVQFGKSCLRHHIDMSEKGIASRSPERQGEGSASYASRVWVDAKNALRQIDVHAKPD